MEKSFLETISEFEQIHLKPIRIYGKKGNGLVRTFDLNPALSDYLYVFGLIVKELFVRTAIFAGAKIKKTYEETE